MTVIILLASSQLLDIYSAIIKGTHDKQKGRELIGLANWIQYIARCAIVLSLLLLSILLEGYGNSDAIISTIFIGLLIGFFLSCCLLKSSFFEKMLSTLLKPFVSFSFKILKNQCFHYSFSFFGQLSKVGWATVASNLFLGVALVLPFTVATLIPDMRMTAAYSGQILNFIATIIVLNFVDPVLFRMLDNQTESNSYSICITVSGQQIVRGRLFAQFILILLLALIIMM